MTGPGPVHRDAGGPAPLGAVLGPAPLWAVVAVLGALGGEAWSEGRDTAALVRVCVTTLALVALSVVVLASVLIVVRVRRRADVVDRMPGPSPLAWPVGVLAVVLVAVSCAAGVGLRIASASEGLLPQLAAQGGSAEVVATVVAEPRRIAEGWQVLVRTAAVDGRRTRERAAVRIAHDPPALGTRLRLRATARPLPDGGYGRWLARQHAIVVLDAESLRTAGAPGRLAAASETVRERVRVAATRHLGDATGGLLVGFVTGDTRLLPVADEEAMSASGLSHLTAVSGSNLAIVLGGAVAVATVVRVGARGRWAVVAVTIPWFAFVTRFEPSVLRAGVMAAVLLVASARGRVRDPRHALATTVLVLILVDPRLAGSLGLLLSALATAGVLVLAPVVRDRLPARMPRRLAELLSITLGAQIAVVPLLVASLGDVGIATVPANLIAVPFAAIAATLGFVATAVALVHPAAGACVFALAGVPAEGVLVVARTFAGWAAVVERDRPATVVALFAGCVWVLARRSRPTATWAAAIAVVATVLTLLPQAAGHLPPTGFTVTAIDVGQGDAFLVETPGSRILVDAGSDDTAARWLRRHGRTSLDLVVVTHPHLDHVGGVPDVLRRTRVAALWVSSVPTELAEAAEVHRIAAERGVPVRVPGVGTRAVVGDVVIEVLHPPPGRPYRFASSEPNESSTVLRIQHGDRRVLLTGDLEAEAQRDLLAAGGEPLRADLVTVAHHGAGTSDPAFLVASGARVGLVSVGADNGHGHPHPATLAVLEAAGMQVRRTDLEGTVRVEVPAAVPAAVPTAVPAAVAASPEPRDESRMVPATPR